VSDNEHVETPDATADENGTSPRTEATDTAPDEQGDDSRSAEERSPEEQIAALKEEQQELNDKLLRKAAEFQNFRRRMQREKKKLFRSGKREVILPMLEVLDDFQRSIEAAEQLQEQDDAAAAYESLKSGVEMVFQKFLDELQGVGVEPIDAEGKPFDENVHEAMMQQPAPEGVEEGTVLHETRTGYRLDDQVLRHSRVIVAS
jgi:molecular chaperone GrpE